MLPSTGFFQDIDCPFYESTCTRPYCHFRHRKKAPEHEPQPAPPQEIPTYKPTPKSELANAAKSHIPISYVPDLVIRSDRVMRPLPPFNIEKPTYKPTPISILANTNALSKCEYVPTSVEDNKIKESNLSDLSKEFDYIDEILKEEKEERKSGGKVKESSSHKSDDRHRKDKYNSRSTSKSKHRDKEKDSKLKSSEKKKDEDKKPSSKDEDKKHSSKDEDRKHTSKDEDKKHSSKEDKKHSSKDEDKKHSSKDEDKKHSSKDEDKRHSDKEKIKDDKTKKHSDRKHREDDKKHKEDDKKHKEESKRRKDDDRKSKENRSKDRDRKSIEDEKKRDDDKKRRHEDKKHDDRRRHDDKKHRSRSEDKKHRDKKESKKIKTEEPPKIFEEIEYDALSPTESLYNDIDFEDTIEEECYRIFNEYKPTEPEINIEDIVKDKTEEASYVPTSKKRIAYDKAEQSGSKISYNKPKPTSNAALVMANRLKLARQSQADNEAKNLMNEVQQGIKRRVSTEAVETIKKVQKVERVTNVPTEVLNGKPKCLVDDILSGRSISSKPRRIAPVQNVNSIQRAKARIDEMARQKAVATFKTPSQTLGKGNKRLAHIPEASLSDIPDVLQAERSKLPVNVRTRYLTMLAEECAKLYVSKEDAYHRALNEEVKCYERCSALATYRNSGMLAVNRLRKEAQEREKSGMGPIQSGENVDKNVDSPFHGKKFYNNISGFILTEDELVLHGYPREGDIPGKAVINRESKPHAYDHLEENERVCCRCHNVYMVDDVGIPLNPEDCNYHPLRKRTLRGERKYLCCKSTEDTGCVVSNTHVSEVSYDRELEGYQSTMEPTGEEDPRNFSVYALDCEMCYTTIGLELTRVTIVDTNLRTIYESLVKPLNPIIDYNTRFSGITKEQMDKTSTSILQVQANILHLCNSKTILIGHSLESDMKALKIIHSSIIDTAVMFPHKFGLLHKRALRTLASDYLKKIIQNDVGGHDSAEDALTCMELVIWKVKEDLKVKGMKI